MDAAMSCEAPAATPTSSSAALVSASAAGPVFRMGGHKSCDACKARKVKCPNAAYPAPCANCVRRKTTCHFGTKKVPKRNVAERMRLGQQRAGSTGTVTFPSRAVGLAIAPAQPSPPQTVTEPGPESDPVRAQTAIVFHAGGEIPKLYIDHMLERAQYQNPSKEQTPFSKGNGVLGGSYSLTIFSEKRLKSLSSRLRNDKISGLVGRINGIISSRLRRTEPAVPVPVLLPLTADTNGCSMPIHPQFAASCVACYFAHTHSQYPFLDQATFEARAADPDLARSLARSKAWSALYYSVLALGCHYTDSETSGNFEPGKGMSWRLFSMALGGFSDLLILPDSLITLQALTAMAVYGLGVSCLSIERVILSEAARRAQSLASTNISSITSSGNPAAAASFQRTFWILYGIEKVMSFHFGRSSAFIDSDICCPMPFFPSMCLDTFLAGDSNQAQARSDTDTTESAALPPSVTPTTQLDWLLIWIRHARLLSRTYSSLFCVGTSCNTTVQNLATIEQLSTEIEEWRLSIPDVRYLRPARAPSAGLASRRQRLSAASTSPLERAIALPLSYLYHSYVLILARARLRHLARVPAPIPPALQQKRIASEQAITASSRAILELTPFIDVETYTPLWLMAVIPMTALLVLFDFVVHHPGSPEAASNLAVLDMGAGFFSQIEYASGGTLPGSLISEFVHIARDYVQEFQRDNPPAPVDGSATTATTATTATITTATATSAVTASTVSTVSSTSTAPTASATATTTQQQPLPPLSAQLLSPSPPLPAPDVSMATGMPPSSLPPPPNAQMGLTDASPLSAIDWTTGGGNMNGIITPVPGFGENYGYDDMGGTDLMGLFNYFLPEMDSMLYQGSNEPTCDN